MKKKRIHLAYEKRDETMTAAEIKADLERIIDELPRDEEKIKVDILLFLRWWDKPDGTRHPGV